MVESNLIVNLKNLLQICSCFFLQLSVRCSLTLDASVSMGNENHEAPNKQFVLTS